MASTFYNYGGTGNATQVAANATGFGESHNGEGSNALFYDGAARWISAPEVQWHRTASPRILGNKYAFSNGSWQDNFPYWSRHQTSR